MSPALQALPQTDRFSARHIGPDQAQIAAMLKMLGRPSLDDLIEATVPAGIRRPPMALPAAADWASALRALRSYAEANRPLRSYIGLGYHGTCTPPVIQRCVLENPGWYTQYTPYQAEISQGRLEALLVFQTVVTSLTGLPIANSSLLDEASAAAEAMHLCAGQRPGRNVFLASPGCHPQTLAVLRTRAEAVGLELRLAEPAAAGPETCGVLIQYPQTDGSLGDPAAGIAAAQRAGALACVATDLLACCLLRPPGELGADIALGSAQRFGVPLSFGGPHAAFFAVREALKRAIPGRIVGVSKDVQGGRALRLSLQTREQHIRREKATSNICTAQALLANLAGFYAVWHGPDGLRAIARRVHGQARRLAEALRSGGLTVGDGFFDTLRVVVPDADRTLAAAEQAGINLRRLDAGTVCIALDETVGEGDLQGLCTLLTGRSLPTGIPASELIVPALRRSSPILAEEVFTAHRSETAMMRWLKRLENRDLSLVHSMIPLGSCTMKLNSAAAMLPITWERLSGIHPYAPADQAAGWACLVRDLESWLGEITGLPAVSLQPNAGSQGEYAGLLAIKGWHQARGQAGRRVCLIPVSAHGTNPASAVMAGLTVVAVACDAEGSISLDDLRTKAEAHRDHLACAMITYPSTHGVFEEGIKEACAIIHRCGGQVYLDGANMNAQVGLTSPAAVGADVCHLNLHKTFAIPHGGGGPGVGPICCAEHLRPFLPGRGQVGPVAASPQGSAGVLPIPWVYIRCMGPDGLTQASRVAILNANYIARRLASHYPILYQGANGTVAHECIIDLRPLKAVSGIEAEDVAKRLMDYGFHAPTLSFPVPGTLMIEPTESEDLSELDRFCEAMRLIRAEIQAVAEGGLDRHDNPLKNAPHTQTMVCADTWNHAYPRAQAAFPAPWLAEAKFWPAVARVDNAFGDRNLVCSCAPPALPDSQGPGA